ncbi:MAG TPA: hypothetical protein PKA10_11035 [Selenomonadales bacterium]|nr:hypothetical protein [Selenomonadales bacterium]
MMNVLGGLLATTKRFWPAQLIRDGVVNARLVLIGLVGVGLLIAGGLMDSSPERPKEAPPEAAGKTPVMVRSYEEALEAKLANLLTQVKGAGAVMVNITLENGSTQEFAKNVVKESRVIQEKDTAGGVRTTTETKESEQILLSKDGGTDRPVMVKEWKPAIKGVLVIAEGAQDSLVKASLTRAVEAGLGIPSYKITVLPQRR